MDTLETVDAKNKWLEVFAKDVATDDLHIGCCMWHIFSYERSPFQYMEHEAAIDAFDILDKRGCYVFIQQSDTGYKIENGKLTMNILSELFEYYDGYVLDSDLKWTFIVTHEDPWFGPYLCHVDKKNDGTHIIYQKQISDLSIQANKTTHIGYPLRTFNITAVEKKTMDGFFRGELPAKKLRRMIRDSIPALDIDDSEPYNYSYVWRVYLESSEIESLRLILNSIDNKFDLAFLNGKTLTDDNNKELIITVLKEPYGISKNPVYLKTPQDSKSIYEMLSDIDYKIFKEKYKLLFVNEIKNNGYRYDGDYCESLFSCLNEIAHFFKMMSDRDLFSTSFVSSGPDELSFICPECKCELFISAEECPVCNKIIKL